MIKLDVDNKEFDIANGYEELSLGQYIDIVKIGESKITLEGYDADIEIISVLSNNREELKNLLWSFSKNDFDELKGLFDWVNDTTIIDKFKGLEPAKRLNIDGKEYGILSNYNKMTLGEIVSFETLLKQNNSDFHRLELAFGVLLRPLDENGNLVEFTEEVFLQVLENKYKINMMDMYATIAFFLSGETLSTTKATKRFSIRQV